MTFDQLDLDELRSQDQARKPKTPFEHQLDSFAALSKAYKFDADKGKGGLLVLPTGAGKTFTTVKWLCDHVVKRNIKVLWLAHSFYLLDQAHKEFREYAGWIPEPRETLTLRVVSSNPSHCSPSDILPSDDVVIVTTQTAIKNLHVQAVDRTGSAVESAFKRFVEDGRRTGLFVVLDEAHHAPAHGCRSLLIGTEDDSPGIRTLVPTANLIGLTATPTYTDETRRGWLGKIFEEGVLYPREGADLKGKLTVQGVLARPNFFPRPTGRELVVDDSLYNRLVREHKDLPEDIIDTLANDSRRNDYIVKEYVEHRKDYGKTIIFADRWFQCVYLKTKLVKEGVRADAVYSRIDADPGSADARNQRTPSDNERIINEFKYGKDENGKDTLDVLINVRMLTEGADVPSVRTVFLTRQTTSQILMAQMIGRALRGRQAGGDNEANIVMFMDEWKRLIDWATPATLDGGTDEGRKVRGYYPLEYVSIRLVEALSRHINNPDEPLPPFARIMPIGWYQTEVVVGDADNEDTQSFTEFVMVYDATRAKFEKLMKSLQRHVPAGWDRENIPAKWMEPQVTEWVNTFFDPHGDDIGNTLSTDIIRIARHVAQKLTQPRFCAFEERDNYNLDEVAQTLMHKSAWESDEYLRREFSKPGSLWRTFYKSYERFFSAFSGALQRVIYEERHGKTAQMPAASKQPPKRPRELPDAEKRQVKKRDGKACLCCGASGKGIRLQVDHVVSYAMGGDTTIENSQTLCSVCNRQKKINEINFLQTATQLRGPKELDLLKRVGKENIQRSLMRLVNNFYHCKAVCDIHMHKRKSGKFYSKWEVELFEGNDPKWLSIHKADLLSHIHDAFGCDHVTSIRITSAK